MVSAAVLGLVISTADRDHRFDALGGLMHTHLGPYVAGEIPEPWTHQFLANDGTPINLTGHTVKISYRLNSGAQVIRDGALVDAAQGIAGYAWITTDMATAGLLRGELVVQNGTNRYARSFALTLDAPSGGPLP